MHTWLPMEPDKDLLSDRFIGKIYCVTSQLLMPERLEKLREWDANGGVLIMGYHMFRGLAGKRMQPDEDVYREVRKILLEGWALKAVPDMVGR